VFLQISPDVGPSLFSLARRLAPPPPPIHSPAGRHARHAASESRSSLTFLPLPPPPVRRCLPAWHARRTAARAGWERDSHRALKAHHATAPSSLKKDAALSKANDHDFFFSPPDNNGHGQWIRDFSLQFQLDNAAPSAVCDLSKIVQISFPPPFPCLQFRFAGIHTA
jgi:hypothetical protein